MITWLWGARLVLYSTWLRGGCFGASGAPGCSMQVLLTQNLPSSYTTFLKSCAWELVDLLRQIDLGEGG